MTLYEHPNPFRHFAPIDNIASGLICNKAKSCSASLLGRAEECKNCSKYILLSVTRWMHLASSLWFWKYIKNSALGSPGFTKEQFITLLPGSALFQMEIYFAQSLTCRSSQWYGQHSNPAISFSAHCWQPRVGKQAAVLPILLLPLLIFVNAGRKAELQGVAKESASLHDERTGRHTNLLRTLFP